MPYAPTSPLLFMHIPKTAGSSLNKSATEAFGRDKVETSYGDGAANTGRLSQEFLHDCAPSDYFGFHEAFIKANKYWFAGHDHTKTLPPLFGCQNTISFVREPVERLMSEYFYLRRKFDLQDDLRAF